MMTAIGNISLTALMRYWKRQKQMMHRKLKNKLCSTRDGLDSNLFFA
jgi:hypothetical protein